MFRSETEEVDEYSTLYYTQRFRVCRAPMEVIPYLLPDDRVACDYVDIRGTTTREGGYFRSYSEGVMRISPLKLCTQHGMGKRRKKIRCQRWRVAGVDSPNDGVVRLYIKPSVVERISTVAATAPPLTIAVKDCVRTSNVAAASSPSTCVQTVSDTLASVATVEAALPSSQGSSVSSPGARAVKKERVSLPQTGCRNITPGYNRW